MTHRSSGKSLFQVIYNLNVYLRGWWNYYRLTEARAIFRSLNGWIFRRLRCLVWTQWKNPRTRVRNLLKLGISRRDAFLCGNARKKMWHMSRIKWVIIAMPNISSIGVYSFLGTDLPQILGFDAYHKFYRRTGHHRTNLAPPWALGHPQP